MRGRIVRGIVSPLTDAKFLFRRGLPADGSLSLAGLRGQDRRIVPVSSNGSEAGIGGVDEVLASAGLKHGRRSTRNGSWMGGERVRRPPPIDRSGAPPASPRSLLAAADWGSLSWLRHGFSTRAGGVSTVYGGQSFNLGWTKEDDPELVGRNRAEFVGLVSPGAPMQLVTLRQVHSGVVRVLRSGGQQLATPDGRAICRGDGMMTDVPGLLLGIGTADCVPVLVADRRQRAVAAFHAGWRGTLGRIVERGIGAMRLEYGSRPADLMAAVGPAIGSCCYAVGEEIQHEFESQFAYAPELFSEVYDSDPVRDRYPLLFLTARAPGHSNIGPQIHLDLAEANRRQLLDAGVPSQQITMLGECTACTRDDHGERRYFSHRAERGFAGRMLSAIGIVAEE